ncbi:MAG TPA: hypothetical protein PLF40_33615, partial [Kofleriaceae bacterium]|nr:hypothetical protein [Kofleriaceae bacterium]
AAVTSNNADITLNATTGNLALNANANAGSGVMRLRAASGDVVQTAGVVTATDLRADASGSVVLPNANSVTGQVAGIAGGSFGLRTAGAVTVGSVAGHAEVGTAAIDGITAGQNIALRTDDGNLTVGNKLQAATGIVGLLANASDASTINFSSTSAVISRNGTDPVAGLILRADNAALVSGAVNTNILAAAVAAGGKTGSAAASDNLIAFAHNNVKAVGINNNPAVAADRAGVNYELRRATGDLVVGNVGAATANSSGSTVTVPGIAGITANEVRLEATAGAVSQNARVSAATLLGVRARDSITLTDTGNVVGLNSSAALLGLTSTSAGVQFTEASGGYSIGTISAGDDIAQIN